MHPNEYSNLLHSTKSKERIKVSDVLEYNSISEKTDTLPVQSQHNDDAVSLGIKRLCKTFINCISLWALAYVTIMIQNITDSCFPLLLFFIPMWIGTIYGFISITTIVKDVFRNGSTLVTEERRFFMESEGISTAEYIDFSSLPLLRKLLFSCFLGFISLILIFISQISFYVWFTTGTAGFLYSILPVILLHLSLLGFCLVSKTFSFSACSIILLSAVGMVGDGDQIFEFIFVHLYVLVYTHENINVCVFICILWEDIFVYVSSSTDKSVHVYIFMYTHIHIYYMTVTLHHGIQFYCHFFSYFNRL
jgi:hypothetical protein